jgi:glucose-1-phosphate thymidylyltransferase
VADFARRTADCVVLVGGRPAEVAGQAGAPRGRMLGMCERRAGGERIVPLGIDLCRPGVLERLEARGGDGASLSDALVDLAAEGGAEAWAVRAPAVRLDSCDAVLEASRLALDEIESDWAQSDVADSRIEGRVVIARGAVVRSSVIRGPAVVGPGAELSHSYVGPYSVIGDRSRVEGAEIENSVLLPEVTISSPGWRLEASVIGARARVTRGFELPAAVRLRVGDGALVHTT